MTVSAVRITILQLCSVIQCINNTKEGKMSKFDYFDDDQPTYEEVMKVEQRLDDSAEWFREVIEYLYGKKPFNENNFERALDELGSYLGVRLPTTDLKVQAKTENVLIDWVNFNNTYLKSL